MSVTDLFCFSDWSYVEDWCRKLTNTFADVYVFTVPLYLPKQDPDGKWRVVSILSTFWGSWAFMIGSVFQLWESLWREDSDSAPSDASTKSPDDTRGEKPGEFASGRTQVASANGTQSPA